MFTRFSPIRFKYWVWIMAAIDYLCLHASLLLGYWFWIKFPWHGNSLLLSDFAFLFSTLPAIGVIVFYGVELYKPEMGVIGVQEQSLIFKAIWLVYFIVLAITFFYRDAQFSRLVIMYSAGISLVLISVERYCARNFFEWLHKKGILTRRAIICGAGYQGQRLERWISQSPKLGIQVIGFIDENISHLQKTPENLPLLGGMEDAENVLTKNNAQLFFIAHPELGEDEIIKLIQICRKRKISFWMLPKLYRIYIERIKILNIGGIPLLGFAEDFGRRSYETVKFIIDKIAAFCLLLVTLPVSLSVAAVIFFSKDRPVFFKQKRVGYQGVPFEMYKFRTLKSTHGEGISPELKKGSAPKISSFQSFLRRSGLDEIPQLINILKGDMSLIGPRPEMPFLVSQYGVLERERLTVRPGITGLWQISEDRKRLLIHENMDYDLYYIQNMSFNLDLAILVKTAFVILKRCFKKEKKRITSDSQ